jgi:hypothetical protein
MIQMFLWGGGNAFQCLIRYLIYVLIEEGFSEQRPD